MKQATLFITVFFSFAFLMGIFLPEEGWAQGNDIISFRIVSETSNQIVMEVNYAYAGNFGSNVFIGAKMANNGKPSQYFAYKPGDVSRGRHSTRVTLSTSSSAPARFTTNQILLSMYIGSSYSFLEEFFPYNKTWSKSSGKPDLTISKINFSPGKPTVNDEITFWVFVKNIGNVKAGPSKLQFRVGGESNPPLISVPALNPNQEYRHTRRINLTVAQNYQVTATADATNSLQELRENNNTLTKRLTVIQSEQTGACSISGRAIGSRANVAPATFFVLLYGPDDDRHYHETQRFNSSGRYGFSGLPNGRYVLVVDTKADIFVDVNPRRKTVVCRGGAIAGVNFEFK